MTASARSSKKDDTSHAAYLKARAQQDPIIPDGWLVRTPDGREFSVHLAEDRDRADASAARIGGTVEWHHTNQSTYWNDEEPHYDH